MFKVKFKSLLAPPSPKLQPWLVVFSAASFMLLVNIATNFNAITPYLHTQFKFSATEIGFLFSCYYYSNILFVVWAGAILDRISARKILLASFIIANFSILIFAFASSLKLMAFARLMLGIIGAFGFLNCFRLIKQWFPAHKIVLVTGIAITCGTCGTLLSQTPLVLALATFGWQTSLLLIFGLGVLLCSLAIIFTQDHPSKTTSNPTPAPPLDILPAIKETISNGQNWLIGFYASLYHLLWLFFSANWGILYLTQMKKLTSIASSYIISANIMGAIIGSILVGWLSYKLYTRKLLLIISTLLTLLILLIIIFTPTNSLLTFIILFCFLGIISGSQVVNYPLVAENNSAPLVSMATGFVSMLTSLSGVYMLFIGWLINYNADNQLLNKGSNNYYSVMLVLVGIMIVSIVLTLFIKENYKKH